MDEPVPNIPPLLQQIQNAAKHKNKTTADIIQQLNEQEYKPQSEKRLTKKDYLIERNKHYPVFLQPENRLDAE